MELSEVRSVVDWINYFFEHDLNHDGRLTSDETPDVSDCDVDRDGIVLPWEVMQAANADEVRPLFYEDEIQAVRRLNTSGTAFPAVILENGDTVEGIPLEEGSVVRFHPCGTFQSGILAFDKEFNGMIFKGRTQISCYENGQVWRGFLAMPARPAENQDLYLAAGSRALIFFENEVRFFENGIVESGVLHDPFIFGGIEFVRDTRIYFYETGKMSSATLIAPISVFGVTFPAGTEVDFSREGDPAFLINEQMTIQSVSFPAGSEIGFSKSGKMTYAILSEDTNIDGIMYRAGSTMPIVRAFSPMVQFYDNGQVAKGTLAQDLTLGDIQLHPGDVVEFDRRGVLKPD